MARATDRNRLAELLGAADWLEADVWTGDADDGQWRGKIDAGRILSVGTTRGRSSAREAVGPGSCALTVRDGLDYTATRLSDAATATRQLEVGLSVRLQLTDAALTALGLVPGSAAAEAVKYRGAFQITDVGPITLTGRQSSTLVVPLTLTSLAARWGNRTWTTNTPAGTSDVDMFQTALSMLLFDPGLWVFGWGTLRYYQPTLVRPPTTPAEGLTAYALEETTFQNIVDAWTAATDGVMFETREGPPDWVRPEARRTAPAPVTLAPEVVYGPAILSQSVGDVVNHVTVSYGSPTTELDRGDAHSQGVRGELADKRDTRLANAQAADDLARAIVAKNGTPRWRLSSVTVDLTMLLEAGRLAEAVAVLGLELTQLVELPALPEHSPVPPGLFWAEGMGDTITPGRWTVTLQLVDYAMLAPGLQWAEVPTSVRWADVPADLDWEHALIWHPDPFAAGTWRGTASNRTWARATGTWAAA